MRCHLRCHYRASGEDTTRIRNEPLSLITEADCETRGCGTTQSTHTFKRTAPHLSLAAVIGAALPVAIWAKARKSHLLSDAPRLLACCQ